MAPHVVRSANVATREWTPLNGAVDAIGFQHLNSLFDASMSLLKGFHNERMPSFTCVVKCSLSSMIFDGQTVSEGLMPVLFPQLQLFQLSSCNFCLHPTIMLKFQRTANR